MPKCSHCSAADLSFACSARARPCSRLCDLTDPAHPDFDPAYNEVVRRWTLEDQSPIELDDRPSPPPSPARLAFATTAPQQVPPGAVVIRTFLNSWSGYGKFGWGLGVGLESVGVPVRYEPISFDEKFLPVGEFQRSRVVENTDPSGWRFQVHFPTYHVPANRPTVCYTMFEASEPPKAWIDNLNRARAIIFPCHWCLDCFKVARLTVPSFVVPGGVDTAVFHPPPGKNNDICRFGMAMRLAHGGCRKGLHEGIVAFLAAFPPKVRDIRLHIKLYPDCETGPIPDDPRIVIDRAPLTSPQMAEWYRGLDVLLVPSKTEGFGLHSLESLACGVPIIAAIETGTAEFATPDCCYPLEGRWEPAGGWYRNQGNWHVPSVYSMIEQLRRVYRNRDEARAKGEAGAKRAMEFSWKISGAKLRRVLEQVGMILPKIHVPLGTPHCRTCSEAKATAGGSA